MEKDGTASRLSERRNHSSLRKRLTIRSIFARLLIVGVCVLTLSSIISSSIIQRNLIKNELFNVGASVTYDNLNENSGNQKYTLQAKGGAIDCPLGTDITTSKECIEAGASIGLSISGDLPSGELDDIPRGCFSNGDHAHFTTKGNALLNEYALICKVDDSRNEEKVPDQVENREETTDSNEELNVTEQAFQDSLNKLEINVSEEEATNSKNNADEVIEDDDFEFFSFSHGENTTTSIMPDEDASVDLSLYKKHQYPPDPSLEDDKNCPFLDSSLYRSVYVYPTWMNETDGWHGPILSNYKNITEWPWLDIDRRAKKGKWGHYGPASNQMGQYTLELIVRELMTHPDSCLRTLNPLKATLFYIPYLPSTEFHDGKTYAADYSTSPYATAIEAAIEGNYNQWEELFGLTSDFWKRKSGADHILVFSEPLHGLSHPRNKRGSHHFIHTQKMLTPPIVVSIEVSTTFVKTYPKCSAKNIVVPYPNPDGNWFNGNFDKKAFDLWSNLINAKAYLQAENETLSIALSAKTNQNVDIFQPRPVAQYYSAGKHGECVKLRKDLGIDYACTASSQAHMGNIPYHQGMRVSTFCPCPGGDSPSAKRMFDTAIAGCIPIILSYDYVWPYTNEADPAIPLDPSLFSIRWDVAEFPEPAYGNQCILGENSNPSVQKRIEGISANEIAKLRKGLKKAASLYSYWSSDGYTGSEYPLGDGILPDGGASKALIKLLGDRAGGSHWPECKIEVEGRVEGKDPSRFVC